MVDSVTQTLQLTRSILILRRESKDISPEGKYKRNSPRKINFEASADRKSRSAILN